jgi:hypothetical protein
MPWSGRTSSARLAALAATALAAALGVTACGGGAGIGERCDGVTECAAGLQCLHHTCVPRCTRHTECGDGFRCRGDGLCERVDSAIGDACASEVDCGPGQACQLADRDFDGDGFLTATCQPEEPGGVLDDACAGPTLADADGRCRSGTCVLGRCVTVCAGDLDCPLSHRCTTIPRELPGAGAQETTVAAFYGCLPARGTITYRVPIVDPYQRFFLPVPGNARSLAMIARVDEGTQLVGADRVDAPSGDILFELRGGTREDYFAGRLRHQLAPGIATLLIPQNPDDPIQPGAYIVSVGSYLAPGTPGTAVPRVDVVYKLDDGVRLDLHLYFLALADHPCADAFAGVTSAEGARESTTFQNVFLRELDLVFARAGIVLDRSAATYQDILDRPDLDGLDATRLGELLTRADQPGGVHVFFVRTIAPAGLQGLVGGPPAPPGREGTRASGVAIAMDTLCYADWPLLARTTAHELGRALGLHRSVEPDQYEDPIADSNHATSNLMHFSEGGGTDLSPGQRLILRLNPALR